MRVQYNSDNFDRKVDKIQERCCSSRDVQARAVADTCLLDTTITTPDLIINNNKNLHIKYFNGCNKLGSDTTLRDCFQQTGTSAYLIEVFINNIGQLISNSSIDNTNYLSVKPSVNWWYKRLYPHMTV